MCRLDKLIVQVASGIELACLLALGGIALKRNNDAYKEACKRIDAERLVRLHELHDVLRDAEINVLKKQVEELKDKYEPTEGEEA